MALLADPMPSAKPEFAPDVPGGGSIPGSAS